MIVEVYRVELREQDALYVRGAVDGALVEAVGWQSALTHHYDADAYAPVDKQGNVHRYAEAQARAMTDAEAQQYIESLLLVTAGAGTQGAHYVPPAWEPVLTALIGKLRTVTEPLPELPLDLAAGAAVAVGPV